MSDPNRKEEKARLSREREQRYASAIQEHAAAGVQFVAFPKIPRLNRDIVITEKIDGTNAAIHIGERKPFVEAYVEQCLQGEIRDELGRVVAQSHTRLLTREEDNFGFAKWVEENAQALREVLGPGIHFGEWWGQGIQRGYGQKQKWFSLFNYNRWSNDPSVASLATIGVQVVPILYKGPWMAVVGGSLNQDIYPQRDAEGKVTPGVLRFAPDVVLQQLASRGSVAAAALGVTYKKNAATGDKGPEGIIVLHQAGGVLFKATIDGDEQSKGQAEAHERMLKELEREGL